MDCEYEVHAAFNLSDGVWHGGHTSAPFPPPTRHGQGFAGHLEHRKEGVLGPQAVEEAAVLLLAAGQTTQAPTLDQTEQVLHALEDVEVVAHHETVLFEHPPQHAVVQQPVRLPSGP